VPEILAYLTGGTAHFIYEGEPAEQAAKVERFRTARFFEFIEIVPEKGTPSLWRAGSQKQNREDLRMDDRQQPARDINRR